MRFRTTIWSLLLFAGMATGKDASVQLKVKGMKGDSSVDTVRKALIETNGVKSVEVSRCSRFCLGLGKGGVATVVYDESRVNEQQLKEAVNRSGFKAVPAKRSK